MTIYYLLCSSALILKASQRETFERPGQQRELLIMLQVIMTAGKNTMSPFDIWESRMKKQILFKKLNIVLQQLFLLKKQQWLNVMF